MRTQQCRRSGLTSADSRRLVAMVLADESLPLVAELGSVAGVAQLAGAHQAAAAPVTHQGGVRRTSPASSGARVAPRRRREVHLTTGAALWTALGTAAARVRAV